MQDNIFPIHKKNNLRIGIIHLSTEGIQIFVGVSALISEDKFRHYLR